jgi:hypothetical protein
VGSSVHARKVDPLRPWMLTAVALLILAGCSEASTPPEQPEKEGIEKVEKQPSTNVEITHKEATTQVVNPGLVGDSVEVGPFLMTLNDARPYSAGDNQDERADTNGHYYAVADLTLENSSEESLDASRTVYLLRDEEGYSFDIKSLYEQRPQPGGQVMPDGKASGEVTFDLGKAAPKGPLTLYVSLSEHPDVPPATFEFEVTFHEKKPQAHPSGAQEDYNSKSQDASAEESPPDEPNKVVEASAGSLTIELPPDWEAETGAASEGAGGPNSWSYYAGEYIESSITAAHNLQDWKYGGEPTSGTYIVASKSLAQTYTDDELIHSLLYDGKANKCTAGPFRDFDRPPYSGMIQTWYDCGLNDNTSYVVSAAPEGRECVVVLDVITASTADREAVEHILDSFEVNCAALPSPTPVDASVTASPSASTESSTSPSANPRASSSPCPNTRITPDGVQCSNLPDVIPGSPDAKSPASPSTSPPPGGDIDCDQVNGPIPTPPGDPNNLDGDGDGVACE